MVKTPHWPCFLGYKPINLGLERILQLLEKLDNPHMKLPPVVHIAGTNGKGSTIAFLRSVLEEAGYKVHIYTSPHLIEFNERIVLSGKQITDNFLNEILDQCKRASEGIDITFFEGTTAAAFLAFSKVKADIVLLETGLGGRLDATNVIESPLISVITRIDIDHTEYLGDKIENIAGEKAGIIKHNVKCITTEQKQSVADVLQGSADKMSSELVFSSISCGHELSLLGDFQKQNAALAITVMENIKDRFNYSQEDLITGLKNATWPARMQNLTSGKLFDLLPKECELWLDGGHNDIAAKEIGIFIDKWTDKKLYLIIGMLKNRDYSSFLSIIHHYEATVVGVPIPDQGNSYTGKEIAFLSGKQGVKSLEASNITNAIKDVAAIETESFRVLICGSLYLAGTALAENQ